MHAQILREALQSQGQLPYNYKTTWAFSSSRKKFLKIWEFAALHQYSFLFSPNNV